MATSLLAVYCVLITLVSVLGGQFPLLVRLTHLRVQLMMSFVGGLMLAVALLHLLPHAAATSGSLDTPAIAAVVGLLFTFFLIRVFHVHQHEPGQDPQEHGATCEHAGHDHVHTEVHTEVHSEVHSEGHPWSWVGLAVGLGLHTLIDGVALGASVSAEAAHDGGWLPGLATFLAILLHKPLDAMAITMLMTSRGWTGSSTTLINILFGLMCPLGALVFYFGAASLGSLQPVIVGAALGFAAGAFLCISLADLLPEIQFHSHDTAKLSAALVAGALLAFAIRLIEPEHAHDAPGHAHERHEQEAEYDHSAQE
ncbi:MAG: ZIP family metal transporter [Pirellulaceae bacterium]|nr:ZIP family metal transporter [Pirellulaceae bacterium]